jgi:hypothetical protein
MDRDGGLQRFLDRMEQAIAAGAKTAEQRAVGAKVFSALRERAGHASCPTPHQVAGCRLLEELFGNIAAEAPPVAELGAVLATLSPRLVWYRRANADPAHQPFYDGHANATIAGTGGLEERADVWIGATLMAPRLTYPEHDHPPEEVYVALTPGEWWNASMDWTSPGIGGLIYNPPAIRHTMRSGDKPFLAVWCLPMG